MQIVSRKNALDLGLKRYFTGKPCPHGHVCERYVSGWVCCECALLGSKKWQKENPEKAKRINKKSIAANKEKISQRYNTWYYENLDYHKKWREQNREAVNFSASKYRKNNPEKVLALNASRRALRSGSVGTHTSDDVFKMLKLQKHKCANCLTDISNAYHVDHIMPLALGGSNWPENLQCLCPTCNLKKNAKHPIDWAQENGRLI